MPLSHEDIQLIAIHIVRNRTENGAAFVALAEGYLAYANAHTYFGCPNCGCCHYRELKSVDPAAKTQYYCQCGALFTKAVEYLIKESI